MSIGDEDPYIRIAKFSLRYDGADHDLVLAPYERLIVKSQKN